MFLLYKKMVHKNYFLIIASLLILTPRVFAQWGGWGYYYSPMDYLNSEWVLFAIISLVFFAVIFYTVNKSFHNKAVAGTIAIAARGGVQSDQSGKCFLWVLLERI